ncbi:MAG: triphosphoribosyl-dephospho-CoA synthase [Pirellulales bacterium]
MSHFSRSLSAGAAATLACIYEATARKPGNVHPDAGFEDATNYAHFVTSAVVIGPILDQAHVAGVGRTVLDSVRATRAAVGTNTNLGTLLLLAPLAAVPPEQSLQAAIGQVLDGLTSDDTRLVYEAVRLSEAGGLGRVEQADVFADPPPPLNLVDAMRLAADRDFVAGQYTNRFADVFGGPAEWIADGLTRGWPLSAAIVHAHVRQLAVRGDSLIVRKCGPQIAREASDRAAVVLQSGSPGEPPYEQAIDELDAWLRADGHRRNPGTTADFIAAGLFVLLREGRLDWLKVTWA